MGIKVLTTQVLTLVSSATLFACGPFPEVGRVLCGFADVLIAETDIAKVAGAFEGEDSDAAKVCRAVRAFTESPGSDDSPITGQDPTTLPLPNGQEVIVTLVPPTR